MKLWLLYQMRAIVGFSALYEQLEHMSSIEMHCANKVLLNVTLKGNKVAILHWHIMSLRC